MRVAHYLWRLTGGSLTVASVSSDLALPPYSKSFLVDVNEEISVVFDREVLSERLDFPVPAYCSITGLHSAECCEVLQLAREDQTLAFQVKCDAYRT